MIHWTGTTDSQKNPVIDLSCGNELEGHRTVWSWDQHCRLQNLRNKSLGLLTSFTDSRMVQFSRDCWTTSVWLLHGVPFVCLHVCLPLLALSLSLSVCIPPSLLPLPLNNSHHSVGSLTCLILKHIQLVIQHIQLVMQPDISSQAPRMSTSLSGYRPQWACYYIQTSWVFWLCWGLLPSGTAFRNAILTIQLGYSYCTWKFKRRTSFLQVFETPSITTCLPTFRVSQFVDTKSKTHLLNRCDDFNSGWLIKITRTKIKLEILSWSKLSRTRVRQQVVELNNTCRLHVYM